MPKHHPLALQPRDLVILQLLASMRHLTREQLHRTVSPETQLSTFVQRLHKLAGLGRFEGDVPDPLLRRRRLPCHGPDRLVYHLSPAGLEYAAATTDEPPPPVSKKPPARAGVE